MEKKVKPPRAAYSLTDDTLIVTCLAKSPLVRSIPRKNVSRPEIYNGNVVELFICTTAKPGQTPRPYYEFEVSPYNQELQVLIDINGKFNKSGRPGRS